jgi:4-aminobutyrate aminotransferase-like enzyme
MPKSIEQLRPAVATDVPGPRSVELAKRLSQVESRNVTCLAPDAPIFWQRAQGVNVWDVDDNRFVDLSGAFGVANVGHAHPEVVAAIAAQASELLHGMGDVHPSAVKVELLEALCARFPGGEAARAVLVSSGSDAVEVALKTALLATGKPGVIAFEGGYHGLSLGALDATWRKDFRAPFASRLAHATGFARFGDPDDVLRVRDELAERGIETAAVLVEPVQGRGGERIPPEGFLSSLRERCDAEGWLLIADEVYTGFGRTGRWFGCDHESVAPDLLCVGKGLSSGMPIAACVGRAAVMDAWPVSSGEALHTQTFLGHPAGCAAALACLRVLEGDRLVEHSADVGRRALEHAHARLATRETVSEVRGLGLMLGIECQSGEVALAACTRSLERGYILLPSGEGGRVLSLTPPLTIDSDLLLEAIDVLADVLA